MIIFGETDCEDICDRLMEDLKNKEPEAVADQNALTHSLRSFISNNWTLVKFMVVGASGTVVNLGVLALLTTLFGNGLIIVFNAIAVETSILNNFVWNDKFTFGTSGQVRRASKAGRLAKYNLLSLASFSVNEVVFIILYSFGLYKYLASIIAIGVAFIVNYIGSSRWAWKDSRGLSKSTMAPESK